MTYVSVVFDNSKSDKLYTYRSNIDVKIGDSVVIETVHGTKLARIAVVHDESNKEIVKPKKFILEKIDNAEIYYRKEEIKDKLNYLIKKFVDIEKYESHADKNPEIAALLKELKDLEGGK